MHATPSQSGGYNHNTHELLLFITGGQSVAFMVILVVMLMVLLLIIPMGMNHAMYTSGSSYLTSWAVPCFVCKLRSSVDLVCQIYAPKMVREPKENLRNDHLSGHHRPRSNVAMCYIFHHISESQFSLL